MKSVKLRYDLYCVKYMSIALDLGIVSCAVRNVRFGNRNAQVPTSKNDAMLAVRASR